MTQSVPALADSLIHSNSPHNADCLRATGLVKSFRSRKVVKGVAIEVYAGEVVGLVVEKLN